MSDQSVSMATTIQVSEANRDHLRELRIHSRETYDDVISRLLEDHAELSEETKRDIEEALREAREGGTIPHADVKKEFGL